MSASVVEEPTALIDNLRNVNVFLGCVALLVMVVLLAYPRWNSLTSVAKLMWQAAFLLCLSGTYGTFEILYLETHFRVPMVTISMMWILAAGVIAFRQDRETFWKRKR